MHFIVVSVIIGNLSKKSILTSTHQVFSVGNDGFVKKRVGRLGHC